MHGLYKDAKRGRHPTASFSKGLPLTCFHIRKLPIENHVHSRLGFDIRELEISCWDDLTP